MANFSSNVQQALTQLSLRFGGSINKAYESPSNTKNEENASVRMANERVEAARAMASIAANLRAINYDMGVLNESKGKSPSDCVQKVRGYRHLGKDTYLEYLIWEDSDEDDEDYCDEDTASMNTDDEDEDGSFYENEEMMSHYDDVEYDSDCESIDSLDSEESVVGYNDVLADMVKGGFLSNEYAPPTKSQGRPYR